MKIKAFFRKYSLYASFGLICVTIILMFLPFSSGLNISYWHPEDVPDTPPLYHPLSFYDWVRLAVYFHLPPIFVSMTAPLWALVTGFWCFSKKKKLALFACALGGVSILLSLVDWLVYNELFPVGFVIAALHLLALALQVYALVQEKKAAR